jgi:hypothetical protein
MKTVIITRKYWGTSELRDVEGQKCCLGFVSEALGVSAKETLCVPLPRELPKSSKKFLPAWMKYNEEESDVKRAANINDHRDLTWEKKEELLKTLFAKHNIRLVFRGQR